jgi:hypothetical protein
MVLITSRHKARLGTKTLQGLTPLETITTINEITASRFYVENGEVFSESDTDYIGECPVCNKLGSSLNAPQPPKARGGSS